MRITAVRWVSFAAILAAGVWPHIGPYDVFVRFLVAAGAIALMVQALQDRKYAFGAVFGALALLFNPVAPVFAFSGQWQRALLVASTFPFVASLAWRQPEVATNV